MEFALGTEYGPSLADRVSRMAVNSTARGKPRQAWTSEQMKDLERFVRNNAGFDAAELARKYIAERQRKGETLRRWPVYNRVLAIRAGKRRW